MSFAQAQWLYALLLVPLLAVVYALGEKQSRETVSKLVAARLADRLASSVNWGLRRLRVALVLAALLFGIVAAAQPRWGSTWQQTKLKGRDILIAIDTSKSMLAQDLKPNRLQRAKFAAQDLLSFVQGDRVGVIAFAGTSFLQAPLTADHNAVISTLNSLDTEVIPEGGSNIAEAISVATDAFGKGEGSHRALIIFSDGEEFDTDAIKSAKDVSETMRIFTVGLGSSEGTLLPDPETPGRFIRDRDGQFVKSRLDEARLRAVAEAGGGFYTSLQQSRVEMERIYRDGLQPMSEQEQDIKMTQHAIERFQWPLALACALLAASMLMKERRETRKSQAQNSGMTKPKTAPSTAAALLLVFLTVLNLGASARNAGITAWQSGDYKEAERIFKAEAEGKTPSPDSHYNLGCTQAQLGDLDGALSSFSRVLEAKDARLQSKAAYNLANTLANRGAKQESMDARIKDWRNGIQHYDKTLALEPGNAEAKHNRDVLAELLKKLEDEKKQEEQDKQDQKKDQQKQDGEEKEEQDKSEDGDQGDKGDKDQESKDGSSKDQKSGDKSEDGESGEKKDQKEGSEEKDGKDGDKKPESSQQEQGTSKPGEKKDGELKNRPQGNEEDKEKGEKPEPADAAEKQEKGEKGEKKDAQEIAQEEAAAAAEGRMTESQARVLLESLRREDRPVRLMENSDKMLKPRRPTKDW